tara:strand:- start:59001 stop:60128 length:1128 start_codon:yes stop_codon:yes gene_type:complete
LIEIKKFFKFLKKNKIDFFTGIPDSVLKDFCNYLDLNFNHKNHVISSNEGTAISLAAGYNLATKKVPLVYLQNSGFGNLLNPILSLLDESVYSIPCLVLMGWRGEPKKYDEPQHITQGKLTRGLIKLINKNFYIIKGKEKEDFKEIKKIIIKTKKESKPYFILAKKGMFFNSNLSKKNKRKENNLLLRERVIEIIINSLRENYRFVSSTGMISRELYEVRNKKKSKKCIDFLTVGSMGHSSQIACGIAINSKKKIVCIDGDGSILMHLGGLSTIGNLQPKNFIHIALNNGTHESVGGQKTTSPNVILSDIAKTCGYKNIYSKIKSEKKLKLVLKEIKKINGPTFIECKIKNGHRENLGRPKEKPIINKIKFMKNL